MGTVTLGILGTFIVHLVMPTLPCQFSIMLYHRTPISAEQFIQRLNPYILILFEFPNYYIRTYICKYIHTYIHSFINKLKTQIENNISICKKYTIFDAISVRLHLNPKQPTSHACISWSLVSVSHRACWRGKCSARVLPQASAQVGSLDGSQARAALT